MNEVAKCQARDQGATLDDVERAYNQLSTSYREEYVMYSLASAALAQALPRFQSLMSGWSPLAEPRHGAERFARWRPLLESPGARSGVFAGSGALDGDAGEQDPYLLLVCETILPPLRSACLNAWEPRDPEPLLAFLETWEPLLPKVLRWWLL